MEKPNHPTPSTPNLNNPPVGSKIFVITPEQIAKLGLTSTLNNAIQLSLARNGAEQKSSTKSNSNISTIITKGSNIALAMGCQTSNINSLVVAKGETPQKEPRGVQMASVTHTKLNTSKNETTNKKDSEKSTTSRRRGPQVSRKAFQSRRKIDLSDTPGSGNQCVSEQEEGTGIIPSPSTSRVHSSIRDKSTAEELPEMISSVMKATTSKIFPSPEEHLFTPPKPVRNRKNSGSSLSDTKSASKIESIPKTESLIKLGSSSMSSPKTLSSSKIMALNISVSSGKSSVSLKTLPSPEAVPLSVNEESSLEISSSDKSGSLERSPSSSASLESLGISRSGRRRKTLNYASLNSGDDLKDQLESKTAAVVAKKRTSGAKKLDVDKIISEETHPTQTLFPNLEDSSARIQSSSSMIPSLSPRIQNPVPGIQNPVPGIQNPVPGIQNPSPQLHNQDSSSHSQTPSQKEPDISLLEKGRQALAKALLSFAEEAAKDAKRSIEKHKHSTLDSQSKVNQTLSEISDSKLKINDLKTKLDDSKSILNDSKLILNDSKLKLNDSYLKMNDSKSQLNDSQSLNYVHLEVDKPLLSTNETKFKIQKIVESTSAVGETHQNIQETPLEPTKNLLKRSRINPKVNVNIRRNQKPQLVQEEIKSKDGGIHVKDVGKQVKDEGTRVKDEGTRVKDEGIRVKDEGVQVKYKGIEAAKDEGIQTKLEGIQPIISGPPETSVVAVDVGIALKPNEQSLETNEQTHNKLEEKPNILKKILKLDEEVITRKEDIIAINQGSVVRHKDSFVRQGHDCPVRHEEMPVRQDERNGRQEGKNMNQEERNVTQDERNLTQEEKTLLLKTGKTEKSLTQEIKSRIYGSGGRTYPEILKQPEDTLNLKKRTSKKISVNLENSKVQTLKSNGDADEKIIEKTLIAHEANLKINECPKLDKESIRINKETVRINKETPKIKTESSKLNIESSHDTEETSNSNEILSKVMQKLRNKMVGTPGNEEEFKDNENLPEANESQSKASENQSKVSEDLSKASEDQSKAKEDHSKTNKQFILKSRRIKATPKIKFGVGSRAATQTLKILEEIPKAIEESNRVIEQIPKLKIEETNNIIEKTSVVEGSLKVNKSPDALKGLRLRKEDSVKVVDTVTTEVKKLKDDKNKIKSEDTDIQETKIEETKMQEVKIKELQVIEDQPNINSGLNQNVAINTYRLKSRRLKPSPKIRREESSKVKIASPNVKTEGTVKIKIEETSKIEIDKSQKIEKTETLPEDTSNIVEEIVNISKEIKKVDNESLILDKEILKIDQETVIGRILPLNNKLSEPSKLNFEKISTNKGKPINEETPNIDKEPPINRGLKQIITNRQFSVEGKRIKPLPKIIGKSEKEGKIIILSDTRLIPATPSIIPGTSQSIKLGNSIVKNYFPSSGLWSTNLFLKPQQPEVEKGELENKPMGSQEVDKNNQSEVATLTEALKSVVSSERCRLSEVIGSTEALANSTEVITNENYGTKEEILDHVNSLEKIECEMKLGHIPEEEIIKDKTGKPVLGEKTKEENTEERPGEETKEGKSGEESKEEKSEDTKEISAGETADKGTGLETIQERTRVDSSEEGIGIQATEKITGIETTEESTEERSRTVTTKGRTGKESSEEKSGKETTEEKTVKESTEQKTAKKSTEEKPAKESTEQKTGKEIPRRESCRKERPQKGSSLDENPGKYATEEVSPDNTRQMSNKENNNSIECNVKKENLLQSQVELGTPVHPIVENSKDIDSSFQSDDKISRSRSSSNRSMSSSNTSKISLTTSKSSLITSKMSSNLIGISSKTSENSSIRNESSPTRRNNSLSESDMSPTRIKSSARRQTSNKNNASLTRSKTSTTGIDSFIGNHSASFGSQTISTNSDVQEHTSTRDLISFSGGQPSTDEDHGPSTRGQASSTGTQASIESQASTIGGQLSPFGRQTFKEDIPEVSKVNSKSKKDMSKLEEDEFVAKGKSTSKGKSKSQGKSKAKDKSKSNDVSVEIETRKSEKNGDGHKGEEEQSKGEDQSNLKEGKPEGKGIEDKMHEKDVADNRVEESPIPKSKSTRKLTSTRKSSTRKPTSTTKSTPMPKLNPMVHSTPLPQLNFDALKSNFDSSMTNLDSSATNFDSSMIKMDTSTTNLDSPIKNIDSSMIKIDSSKIKIDSSMIKIDSSMIKIDSSMTNIDSSIKFDSPATIAPSKDEFATPIRATRGRPKKLPAEQTPTKTEVPTPKPQKAGRKRKVDSQSENVETLITEESTGGKRKRRIINYAALVGEESDDDTPVKVEQYKGTQRTTRGAGKRKKVDFQDEYVKGENLASEAIEIESLANASVMDASVVDASVVDASIIDASQADQSDESDTQDEDESFEEQPTKRRKVRKSKYTKSEKHSNEEISSTKQETFHISQTNETPKVRGKQMKEGGLRYVQLDQYCQRMRDFAEGLEMFPETSGNSNSNEIETDDKNLVVCALCKLRMPLNKFNQHKLKKHNNISWIEGNTPIDLTDVSAVSKILTTACKKKKALSCDICNDSRKSIAGFLGHFVVCQRGEEKLDEFKQLCPHCNKRLLPSAIPSHIVISHKMKQDKVYKKGLEEVDGAGDVLGRRKAATKAMSVIEKIKLHGEIVDTEERDRFDMELHVFKNFDFRPTRKGKQKLQAELSKNIKVKCRYENCTFISSDVKSLQDHLFNCELKPPQNFTCKWCIIPFKTLQEVEEHVNVDHSVDMDSEKAVDLDVESGSSDEDSYEEPPSKNKVHLSLKNAMSIRLWKLSFLNYKDRFKPGLFTPCYKWTLSLYESNCNIMKLFPSIYPKTSNWSPLEPTMIRRYLPSLRRSIAVCKKYVTNINENVKKLSIDSKRYKLFESDCDSEGYTTTFCGGPIQGLAWAPTPFTVPDCDQILAVNVCLDPNYAQTSPVLIPKTGIIQFWNYGPLKNNCPAQNPILEFCIAHDYGILHDMKWCPSGCFDTEMNDGNMRRIGLLAVASSDSNVYVYAVCSRELLSGKIFKPKPTLKLNLGVKINENVLGETNYYATRLAWSKGESHKHIAVGYSNGTVGFYDVETSSSLLLDNRGEIHVILPVKVFPAHAHIVTFVALHPLNGGNRWLITSSLIDKTVKYWDLENHEHPIISYKKTQLQGVAINSNWLGFMGCSDDSATILPNSTGYTFFRQKDRIPFNSIYTNGCATTISVSDWSNVYIHGTNTGEVSGSYPTQLCFNMEYNKKNQNRRFIGGFMKLIDNSKSYLEPSRKPVPRGGKFVVDEEVNTEVLPQTYQEAQEKYTLVFCDFKLNQKVNFTGFSHHLAKSGLSEESQSNVYPIRAVTKVEINPNKESYLHFAVGYQSGFLKVHNLQIKS